jgi:glycosyltransferase involved in cell wall biosynthesis
MSRPATLPDYSPMQSSVVPLPLDPGDREGYGEGEEQGGPLFALVEPARIPVTIVIPTLNEASRLRATLSALFWADEVIVVDGGSTDATTAIARSSGARVIPLPDRTIGAQRNAGIAAARNLWILALDADEQVTPELRDSLAHLTTNRTALHSAYRVRSRNWHLGRELRHGPWGHDWKVRVFTREQRFTEHRVHENIADLGNVGSLNGTLLHHPYRDLSHQVFKIAKYAKWAAADLRGRGRRTGVSDLVIRPAWRFARDYVVMSGWRDGTAGLITSVASAFSVFLKYACLLTDPPAQRSGD